MFVALYVLGLGLICLVLYGAYALVWETGLIEIALAVVFAAMAILFTLAILGALGTLLKELWQRMTMRGDDETR